MYVDKIIQLNRFVLVLRPKCEFTFPPQLARIMHAHYLFGIRFIYFFSVFYLLNGNEGYVSKIFVRFS